MNRTEEYILAMKYFEGSLFDAHNKLKIDMARNFTT